MLDKKENDRPLGVTITSLATGIFSLVILGIGLSTFTMLVSGPLFDKFLAIFLPVYGLALLLGSYGVFQLKKWGLMLVISGFGLYLIVDLYLLIVGLGLNPVRFLLEVVIIAYLYYKRSKFEV